VLNHWKIHSRSDSPGATDSMRRLTNDGERATEQAMTSVFYNVIRLESVRGR